MKRSDLRERMAGIVKPDECIRIDETRAVPPSPTHPVATAAAATEAAPALQASPPGISNATIAEALTEMAMLLEGQGDNPFRVAAYRRAGGTVARLDASLREFYLQGGAAALDALPGIGPRIASAIVELLQTGHWQQLERLRGSVDPPAPVRAVPALVPDPEGAQPPVALLLQVDHEYRAAAEAGRLPRIAPKRFNPEKRAWLPVLHTEKSGWHFTARYSNTARAHALGRTHDWVVIYAEDLAHHERPCTVVTAARGVLAGRRVVRGRESACRQWYAQAAAGPDPAGSGTDQVFTPARDQGPQRPR